MTNFPWEERPEGCTDVMWRYTLNPIIDRYQTAISNSIFNSAVVPFGDGFAGVFRCDDKAVRMNIFAGFSPDGIHWEISDTPIEFKPGNTDMIDSDYKYDPRVTWIEDRYWITWCNGYNGPTIGIGYTFDFKTFYQCENAFLPFNRNGVLLPQKFDGRFAMLSRPSDNGHTPFGDIFISYSPDMKYWGEHRCVMKVTPFEESAWQCLKIGAGSVPFLTGEGWLMFYHGVIRTCNGYRYAMGAARPRQPRQGSLPYTRLYSRTCSPVRTRRRCAQCGIPLRRTQRRQACGRVLRRRRHLRVHGLRLHRRNYKLY